MSPPLKITPAVIGDLADLATLDRHVFGHISYPLFVFRQFLDIFADGLVVGRVDGAVVGYALVAPVSAEKHGYFVSLGVAADARGRGYGRALAIAGINRLRRFGLTYVKLTVEADNAPAIELYRTLGFHAVERDEDYFGPGEPRVVMVAHLS